MIHALPDPIEDPLPLDEPAKLSLADLRHGIRDSRTRLWAMDVVYQTIQTACTPNPNLIPLGRYRHGYRGEKRLAVQLSPAKGTTGDEPTFMWVCDVESTTHYDGQMKSAYVSRDHGYELTDFYTHSLGIAVTDDERASVNTGDHFLPHALENPTWEWRVEDRLSAVDGAVCHVLVSKLGQRLWVDPAIGFAIRFRETRQRVRDRDASQWPLLDRALFGDWEPVADGLWLPKRIQIASYVSARNPEPQWNRPDVLMERLVEAIAVNDQVPESIFTIAYPQGTIIRDSINERAYRVEEDGATTDVTPSHT